MKTVAWIAGIGTSDYWSSPCLNFGASPGRLCLNWEGSMDMCEFCRSYHVPWFVCDGYIKWLKRQVKKWNKEFAE